MKNKMLKKILLELSCFKINDDQVRYIIQSMGEAFEEGLQRDPSQFHYPSVKMIPTYLGDIVVDMSKKGGFYFSVDLGGTNLRVFLIEFLDERFALKFLNFVVPTIAMTGCSDDLFDFIASSIKKFLERLEMVDVEIDVFGFTFSFPCAQEKLNVGRLTHWTKGFSTSGVVGQDVVALLKKSCNKLSLKINNFALINDSTGTLLCGVFKNKETTIAVITGTGTNACYLEKISNIKNYQNDQKFDHVIINTEWGGFGGTGRLDMFRTAYDIELDKSTINPGQQIFEKMVSGMYMGEIARLYLIEMDKKFAIFKNGLPKLIKQQNSITAPMLSLSYFKKLFIEMFNKTFDYHLTVHEYKIVFMIFKLIVKRACKLISAGLVALCLRIDQSHNVIACDGSLFKSHPTFMDKVQNLLKKFLPHGKTASIIKIDDGSGKGAALAASVASNLK